MSAQIHEIFKRYTDVVEEVALDEAYDVKYLTGVEVSKSVQQRLVHRQNFELPLSKSTVEELSVDGGNIRIRTPIGQPCDWKGYKAVRLHNLAAIAASFQENNLVVNWVNSQIMAPILTCIGDGHEGIWNIIREFTPPIECREIFDWFHLMENLHKVGGSLKRNNKAKSLLWKDKVSSDAFELSVTTTGDRSIYPSGTKVLES